MDYEIIDTGIENLGSPIQPTWFDICCSGCGCKIDNYCSSGGSRNVRCSTGVGCNPSTGGGF